MASAQIPGSVQMIFCIFFVIFESFVSCYFSGISFSQQPSRKSKVFIFFPFFTCFSVVIFVEHFGCSIFHIYSDFFIINFLILS